MNKQGYYIPKVQRYLAQEIAQQNYNYMIEKQAQKELKEIEKFLKTFQDEELKNIYVNLNESRKLLIEPIVIPDKMYIEKWFKQPYEKKLFQEDTIEIYTDNGERVRSKSEKIIADLLLSNNIKYKYECPLNLDRLGVIYPDFTILNRKQRREIYWEHFGMMDNSIYVEKAVYKINCYLKSGYIMGEDFVVTFETSKRPLDIKVLKVIINKIL